MAFGRFLESSACFLVVIAGFFVAVPLRLLQEQIGETCLLFGQVDFLEKNVTSGNSRYCDLGFYSSVVDLFLGAFLICLRWCCLIKSEKPSFIYGSLISFVVATLAWINCVVRGVFMITGMNEWCSSVKKARFSSCEDAASWNWKEFSPQPLDASKFAEYFFMVEVSSYVAIILWFLVAFLSGTQMRKAIYFHLETQNPFIVHSMQAQQPMDMYDSQSSYINHGQSPASYINQGQVPAGFINQGQVPQQRQWSSYDDQFEEEFDPRIDYGKITHL